MKNIGPIGAIILLILFKVGLSQVIVDTEDEVKETLQFLREGDEQIKTSKHSDIIYILGPTGTGKTTLTHLLAGNPSFLQSIEIEKDSDDFIIQHISEDKIGNVTFQSKTMYPDLIIDENDVPYYDCPGFSDTRKTSIEIATTYFTKKVINYAERLKIVFVVNYHSMLKGISSRNDFLQFLKHATEFLKNVKSYDSGIILVASKVPVLGGPRGDERLTNKIRSFLKEYQQSLLEELERNSTKVTVNELDLINIFLSNERIGLFKRPYTSGLLDQIPEVMKNREELLNSINKRIEFVKMTGNDFGYTLTDRSKLKINALAEEINHKITHLFGQINQQVIDHYSKEYMNYDDISNLMVEFENVTEILSKISANISISEYLIAMNQLDIPTLQRNLVDIKNHIGYMKFLQSVHDKPITKRTSDWGRALQSSLEYLSNEKNWCSFTDKLIHRLSEFDVQRNLSKYDVTDVERWGIGDNETGNGIFITHENFGHFLKKLMAFDLAEKTNASKSKIDHLNNILNTTLKSKTTSTCHNNKLTVKGTFVKLSDLDECESACHNEVRLIEVFGLSTIFIDTDLKKNVDILLIAPKWYVDKERRINLNGADGVNGVDTFKLENSDHLNGKPGMPGQNANHFFGYGNELENSENLYITAVGGNGGHGQSGFSGRDGEEIIVPAQGSSGQYLENYAKLISQSNDEDIGLLYFNRKYWVHEKYQSNVHCPSINGIGGSGGLGGSGGTIELNGMSGIKMLTKNGIDGPHGTPGKCGKIHDQVEIYKTKMKSCTLWIFCGNKVTWDSRRFSDSTCIKNCRTSTLVNLYGTSRPIASNPPKSAFSIDHYKSFVRESMQHMHLNRSLVAGFLRSIEQNSKVRATYDTTSFIDDFFQIEKQFQSLKNESNFIDFYQSLLERILEYVTNRSEDLQVNERRMLANLYTAGLSKICKIRSGTEQNLIIDIESYLDVAIEHIRLVEKTGKKVAINQFRNQYQRNLETKIDDNHAIIATDILPEIEKLNLHTDSVFENLLDKVLDERNSVARNTDHYNQAKKELQGSYNLRGLFKFLKIVAGVASFFDEFATTVSTTVNTVNQIAKAFTFDQSNQIPSEGIHYSNSDEFKDNHFQPKNPVQFSKDRKSEFLLNIVNEILTMATGFSFNDIMVPLRKAKNVLSGHKRVDLTSEEIDLLQEDVQNIITNKTNEVKINSSGKKTNSLIALEKIKKKLSVLEMDVDMFSKFSSDEYKLQEIEIVLRKSQVRLLELNNFERNFRHVLDPMVKYMQSLINQIPNKMNESKISFEVIKWHIQSTLKDFRFQMRKIGGGEFQFEGAPLHIFDKLDGAISTLINIFDRIQIYEDQVKLSNYIANIESADSFGTNSSNQDLDKLNAVIQSNVLLTIFDSAVNAFKQTVFPFSDFYLRRFNLPHQLEEDTSLETSVNRATQELINLKLTLKEYRSASINDNDNIIYTADFTRNFKSSQPFYVWTGNDNYEVIAQLLAGKSVTIKADITNGLKWNAVKFQYLEINLQSSNQTDQPKLDKLLKYFDVTIIHHGNSYYRCDSKFYLITSPIQQIMYSFEKDTNGLPIRRNNVYNKMRNGDFTLSPYALLTISLTTKKPDKFKILNSDFSRTVDLELVGRGQYVNPNIDACMDLDKYYKADELINDFHRMDIRLN